VSTPPNRGPGLDLGGCMARLSLPYPPSANAYWRSVKGRVLVSREGREYKKRVAELARQYLPLVGPVKVRLRVHRPRATGDLDNVLKVLFDALKLILWLDDDQVVTIHATRLEERAGGLVDVEAEGEAFATGAMVKTKRAVLAVTAARAKATRPANRQRALLEQVRARPNVIPPPASLVPVRACTCIPNPFECGDDCICEGCGHARALR
jgi:crossover junction endodeoxyribonuclease RusA